MFQEGNYDKINFPIPIEGMNQFISPEILPSKFCYQLENILPSPLGSGQVRYGDRLLNSLPNQEANILQEFFFAKSDGTRQSILYTQEYTEDLTVNTIVIPNQSQINFDSDTIIKYDPDTPIKFEYTSNGANYTLYSTIKEATFPGGTRVELVLQDGLFINDPLIEILGIYCSVGKIYAYNIDENTFTDVLKDNLSVACIPRQMFFQQSLVIYNGVDKSLVWDGTDIKEIYDLVKETRANAFIRVDANNFSFTALPGLLEQKYFIGVLVQIKIGLAFPVLTVLNVLVVGTTITLTTVEAIPDGAITEVYYQDWPPPFSYMYAGTDRVWALGAGAAGIGWRSPDQALRLYFAYRPNTLTNLFNENSKTVPSIDVSNKHGIPDNLEAICQVGGLTALIGRSKTQIWSGSIPGIVGRDPGADFVWQYNLPVGVANGDLAIEIANDAYFVSKNGLNSFSTLNIANQFAATSANAIDPLISKFLESTLSSNINYRACRSFKYDQGGIAGFKIGKNKVLVSLFENKLYAWSMFSGDFQKSNTFCDIGNSLLLGIDNKIYQYADGNDGKPKIYADNNGTDIISFSWVMGLTKRSFANKFYRMILNYPSQFTQNPVNVINLMVSGYDPSNFKVETVVPLQDRGDPLETAPLGNFRLDVPFNFVTKQFKFKASSFWTTMYGYTMNGPLSFKEIKLFGIGERNG